MNSVSELISLRQKVIQSIRQYFNGEGFLEVETPLLVASPDPEPSIEPFQTTWHSSSHNFQTGYLITSPEFFMKRLLCNGSGSMYQICKCFRDFEPASPQHNPEFTMIEWYRTNADYTDIMADCEKMMLAVLQAVKSDEATTLVYQSVAYDLAAPWERISVVAAFEQYAGIGKETLLDQSAFLQAAAAKGYTTAGFTYDDVFHQIILNEIEPHLGKDKPTFLFDYPASQAALARKKADDPRLAERFELYLGGLELANAFSELTDAQEQAQRFTHQLSQRQNNGQPTWQVDQHFLADLQHGMPPTGGIALGIDRLIMLMADAAVIQDVLPFPANHIFSQTEKK